MSTLKVHRIRMKVLEGNLKKRFFDIKPTLPQLSSSLSTQVQIKPLLNLFLFLKFNSSLEV